MTEAAPASYRRAVGQFASGVVVVTTRGGHAAAVSTFVSVSLDPPLVLFCAGQADPLRAAVLAAGEWAVSILAGTGGLDGAPQHPGPATGAPLLDGALATVECRTEAVHQAGDHSIIIGRVLATSIPAGPAGRSPLIHYAGAYRHLQPPKLARLAGAG